MNFAFETDRLVLRILSPTPESAETALDFYRRNRFVFERYEPERPCGFYTTEYQKSLLAYELNLAVQNKSFRFWVFAKNNTSYAIGNICFYNIIPQMYDRCETGYKFDPHYWHRGYAKEAMELGIFMMFHELNLRRMEAYVMPENTASIRLLQNLGFEYEGTCRQYICIHGRPEDLLLFSYIR